jgi:hypothetical protein
MDFATKFKGYVRTATPLVVVNTFDARATMRNIIDILDAAKDIHGKTMLSTTGISQWDVCRGLKGVNELGMTQVNEFIQKSKTPPAALHMAENLYKVLDAATPEVLRDHFTFVFNAHKFWSNPTEVQGLYNLRDKLSDKGSMLILLAAPGSTLPEEIAQDVMALDEPLPNDPQVEAIITKAYKNAKALAEASKKKIPDALPADVMAKSKAALNGLPAFPIAQASALCLDALTGTMDVTELWDQKRHTVSQRAGLSMFEREGVSLANLDDMDNVINFLQRYNAGPESPNIILRFDEMEKGFAGSGTDLSGDSTKLTGSILSWFQDKRIHGIIFVGVPGCGKSELIYAWAKAVGKPVVNVDIPGMQGSLLGQSMANLQAAEKTIDAMGGGKVLAIASVNEINKLPAPLIRRFDLSTFFFDIPKTEKARTNILNIHRKKYNVNPKDVAPDMNMWTGSDIENCCKRSYMLGENLTDAAKNVVKVMVARREEMDNLRQDANGKYVSASTPGVYQYYDPFEGNAAAAIAAAAASEGRRLKG